MRVMEIIGIKGNRLYTVAPSQTLGEAITAMAELDAGSLVVMAAGKMVGMLTFREVLRALSERGGDATTTPVGEVMVADPVTVEPEVMANELRRMMIEKHIRYMPVIDGGTLCGVISFHDVAKAVLEEQSFENKMLKDYIKNWPAGEQG